ncbi:MAG: hypothetical protein WED04_11180 [Promethearchaeati archaeon SRVP18_Atabeyarchaeia-1]
MIKAVWILLDIGPCLYRYAAEKRFQETDENLFSGFFVALETFAKSIGSEEVLRVELRDLALWFMKEANVVFVVASDRSEDMTEILLKVSRVFSEAAPDLRAPFYNPLISSDVAALEQRIDSKIREVILSPVPPVGGLAEQLAKVKDAVTSALRKPRPAKQSVIAVQAIRPIEETIPEPTEPKTTQQHVRVTGEMIPKLERPLTDVLRERERLVKRFGVAAVDILHHADGKMTVSEIVAASKAEKSTIEDVLSFAQKLGIVEFKQKKQYASP